MTSVDLPRTVPGEKRRDPAAPGTAPGAAEAAPGFESCSADEALSCLLTVTHELTSAPDLTTGLRSFAEGLARFIAYKTLGILLLDDLGRELRFELAIGYPGEVAEHWRFGLGQGLIGTAAKTGELIAVGDVSADSRYISAGEGIRSELAIPLKSRGRVIGVVDIGSSEPHAFAQEDQRLLTSLAGHLAVAIETARLHQNTREQARTLSLLHEVSREVVSILDRRELLERVVRRIRRLIPYDTLSILLWSSDSGVLEPWITVDGEGREVDRPEPVALGYGLCGTAAALRQPLRVPNVHLDPRYVRCEVGIETASELVVPLLFENRLLGVLDLESVHFDAFTPHHEQFLSTLASSLAVALQNARLYERLLANERRMEQDLATAREIQKQLLPTSSPWTPELQFGVGYEPARHLGGDFYDFPHSCDGHVAVALGDVAGKATPAALYGSLALGMLRELTGQAYVGPAEVLATMNERLQALGIGNRFLALAFADFNVEDRSLVLANSGLPHPYLVRQGEVRPLRVEGVPLGLLPERRYQEHRLELRSGDAVVICSDGVEESLDAQERELGPDAVAETLRGLSGQPPQEIADGLLAACRLHTGEGEPSDDRTVVVIKLAASPAR